MKHSVTRCALVFSLLMAGLSVALVPEARAKLSKPKVKRCLLGGISIRATGTERFLDAVPILVRIVEGDDPTVEALRLIALIGPEAAPTL